MEINYVDKHRFRHILASYQNYEKLRRYGYAGDSLNDVITRILDKIETLEYGAEVETVPDLKKILEKKKMVESGSGVETVPNSNNSKSG